MVIQPSSISSYQSSWYSVAQIERKFAQYNAGDNADAEILKTVGKVAGIGGIAIGTFLILFREVIRKNIFSKLTKADTYLLMRWIILLVWSVAIAGIIAYVYSSRLNQSGVLIYQGSVRDAATRLPIKDAEVSFLGRKETAAEKTNDKGIFSFNLQTVGGKFQGKVQVIHPGYAVWDKQLDLSKPSTIEEVLLEAKPLSEYEISGEVRDGKTAIEGVEVYVIGKNVMTVSDKNGRFTMKVKGSNGGSFRLKATKNGYQDWDENVGARNDIIILMERK